MRILPYHLSKSAVIQMCRNFACELAPKGIRVNSISPAFIKTKYASPHPIRIFASCHLTHATQDT